jgi:ketosteroid isomerase-like protein
VTEDSIRTTIRDWDQAMIGNDPAAIGRFMADEWVIVGPDGSVSGKADFLSQVASGALTHDEMTSEDIDLRRYGDTVVVIARGVSGGRYEGQPFRLTERGSNVFVRRDDRWQCVLTHLSTLSADEADR